MTKNKNLAIYIIGAIIVVGAIFVFGDSSAPESEDNLSVNQGEKAIVYKSPTCGCCVGYASEVREWGTDTEIIKTEDMDSIKKKYNIPLEMESCHTTIIGDYFIEGHVPFAAVEKLLSEKPDIDGIALPGMPSGTPGMPGIKTGPYEVYQLKDGIYSDFMSI